MVRREWVLEKVRWARNQRTILVIDGLLGAMIGAVSVGYESGSSPLARFDPAGTFMVGSSVTVVMFAIPMFIATVALVPALLAILRGWTRQSASRYYLKSSLAGIAFGVVACAAVGFVFGLMVPFFPGPGGLGERLMALLGAPFLLGIGFFFAGFLFWKQVLIAGVAFGLFNGWWARRSQPSALGSG